MSVKSLRSRLASDPRLLADLRAAKRAGVLEGMLCVGPVCAQCKARPAATKGCRQLRSCSFCLRAARERRERTIERRAAAAPPGHKVCRKCVTCLPVEKFVVGRACCVSCTNISSQ